MKEEIYQIADQIRSLSNLGIAYSQNPFDTERYDKLWAIPGGLTEVGETEDSPRV